MTTTIDVPKFNEISKDTVHLIIQQILRELSDGPVFIT